MSYYVEQREGGEKNETHYCILLAIAMLSALAVPSFAVQSENTVVYPRYSYINSNSVNLTINQATGVATCTSSCYASSGYTVKIECKLQLNNGSSWLTLKTWTTSADRYASLSKTQTVSNGYTYRVYRTFRIYNSAGTLLETGTNSKSVYFPSN